MVECIDSIFYSTKGISFEIILVDNASDDESPQKVLKFFPSVRLIRNRQNLGFAGAVNRGIDMAGGRYLLILNNDTLVLEGALERLLSFLDEHPRAGIAGADLLHRDGIRQTSYDNIPSLATTLLNKSILRLLFPRRYPSKLQDITRPVEVESVVGACMAVRPQMIQEIGKLDQTYFFFLEETDWCFRARQAGWKVYFVPGAKVVHLAGESKKRSVFRAKVEYTRNLFTFFRKHYGKAHYTLLVTLYLLKTVLTCTGLFILCLLTLFSLRRVRIRLSTYLYLLRWQLGLRPREMGLDTCWTAYVFRKVNRIRWWVHRGYLSELWHTVLIDWDEVSRRAEPVKDLRVKAILRFNLGNRRFLIKIYKVRNWWNRFRYIFKGLKAFNECTNAIRMVDRGVQVVLPAACGSLGLRNFVLIELEEGWHPLDEMLASSHRLMTEYGRFARGIHDAGVYQYDFNPTNVICKLSKEEIKFKMIDTERVKFYRRVPWYLRAKALARMNRAPGFTRQARLRFLKGYAPEDLRGMALRVLAYSTRVRRREVRRLAKNCLSEGRNFGRFVLGDTWGYYRKKDICLEELRQVINHGSGDTYLKSDCTDIISEWRGANIKALDGERLPCAAVATRGISGYILYRLDA